MPSAARSDHTPVAGTPSELATLAQHYGLGWVAGAFGGQRLVWHAGATLGYLVGSSAVRVNGGAARDVKERRLSLGLDSGPSGDGVGLALNIDLGRRH